MRELKYRGRIEGNWWYVRVSDEHTSGSWEQFWCLVDKKTVGQFVGLTDKQNKEVYEGDIVKGKSTGAFGGVQEIVAQVAYDEYQILQPFHNIWDYDCNMWVDCLIGGFEVIGNIHEHPELLKESTNL
jgi:uncharacterized phage protein (TIGR01671 family)